MRSLEEIVAKTGNSNILSVFSKPSGKRNKLKYFCSVKCSQCPEVFNTRLDAIASLCSVCNKKRLANLGYGRPAPNRTTPEKFRDLMARSVFKRYSDGDLTFEKFYELSQMDCYYCRAKPAGWAHSGFREDGSRKDRKRKSNHDFGAYGYYLGVESAFRYNGLDRKNQKEPHNINNVVPCCKICNWMKTNMSETEFIEHIKRIATIWVTKV